VSRALREQWIEEALGYVPRVARRYAGSGIPFEELLAAGNLGLVEAAVRFDPSREVKFVTYADWWIRKTILKTIQEQSGAFRVPRYHLERIRILKTLKGQLRHTLRREPENDELASAAGLPIREVGRLMALDQFPVSLEQPASSVDDRPIAETLSGDSDSDHPEALISDDYVDHLRRKIASLDEREGIVLALRFGLLGTDPLTLREV
jgi:RNA polymerase primary sigma factor